MSLRWVESIAPLLEEASVVEALEEIGARYSVQGSRITVQAAPEPIHLEHRHGGWIVRRLDSTVHAAWERKLETAYQGAETRRLARLEEARRLEEERRREEARRALVAARREAILTKAKEMGYSVREERRGEEIQLVLVRRTY